ncbi:flagellar biosynthesis repressor FlbT [Novosphingobium rhizovicinum]|uniref:Flagellar biosynthesis repressor FlbT n=1 Tax=Novosphingobium rhizovicinum TaxID=3228928 RepID=A0ABV3R8S8_9SPHN
MLRISLRDGEKVVVNGAVMRAVGRTEIVVENKVSVMRGREVMAPEEATTPARQLYFHTMMAYVDPAGGEGHQDRILEALRQVMAVLATPEAATHALSFGQHVAQLQFYKALRDCRQLMQVEAALLEEQGSASAEEKQGAPSSGLDAAA